MPTDNDFVMNLPYQYYPAIGEFIFRCGQLENQLHAILWRAIDIDNKQGRLKAGDPNKISLGMTKLEVMRALGKPETISADSNSATLFYRLERPWWQDKPFKVQIVNDKVVSFGAIESSQ